LIVIFIYEGSSAVAMHDSMHDLANVCSFLAITAVDNSRCQLIRL